MDLFMEHLIKQLKTMTGVRDAPFGEHFFAHIISYNIRYFLEVKESLRSAVGLGAKSGSHKRRKKAVALAKLLQTMQEGQLHRYRHGRKLQHTASDDFKTGDGIFQNTSRIFDFVSRTVADGTDLHEDSNASVHTDDDEPERQDVPLPNMWQNGEVVAGDDIAESDEEGEVDTM